MIFAAHLGLEPFGDRLQQPVAHRMAERVVDVLEQIEIDAQHRDVLLPGWPRSSSLAQPVLVEIAVRQIGQAVMVRHVGDAGFRLAPLGDVDNRHQIAVATVEGDAAAEGQDMDFAAVGLEMPPVAIGMVDLADVAQRLAMHVPFVLRPDLPELHAQELFARRSRNAARRRR